jgi:hypothetical protein
MWRRKGLLARYECRRGREVVGNSASFASVLVDSASMFIVSRIQLCFEFVVEKLWVFLISMISGNRMGGHTMLPAGRPCTPRSLNS